MYVLPGLLASSSIRHILHIATHWFILSMRGTTTFLLYGFCSIVALIQALYQALYRALHRVLYLFDGIQYYRY